MIRFLLIMVLSCYIIGCSEYPDNGVIVDIAEESPVVMDLDRVPYATLSEYNLFQLPLKNQEPVYGVIPYAPINTLFTDYAQKKRFVWMPDGTKAIYVSDAEPFEFPEGAILVKSFYYDNAAPENATQILETRLMIRKNGQWIFANYIWNESQTEAVLDLAGRNVPVSWTQNGTTMSADYRIPSESECLTCHKLEETPVLIGPKPRNLNSDFVYTDGIMNQIQKWTNAGYLEARSLPQDIVAIPSWQNTALPQEERVRAYMDMNCAHCHKELAHCSYRPVRFAWEESGIDSNLGLCETATEPLDGYEYVVQPGNHQRSGLYYRITTDDVAYRMPFLGRTIVHEEAADLIENWINDMEHQNCN